MAPDTPEDTAAGTAEDPPDVDRNPAPSAQPDRDGRWLPVVMLVGVIVRLPLWLTSLRIPVDGDTAIVGLMARRLAWETTFWGQPYGSPLDAWIAAPFVALLGPTVLALRLPYLLLSLALIPLAFFLARELRPAAALPAAVLLACPPGFFLLLAALPPPLYPTSLVLQGLLLVSAPRLANALAEGRTPRAGLVLWGVVAGLALWTHLLSSVVIALGFVFLALRAGRRRFQLTWTLVPLLAASAPWWAHTLGDPRATEIVRLSAGTGNALQHAWDLLPRMQRPILGLLGGLVPYTAGDPDQQVLLPFAGRLLVVLIYLFAPLLAVRRLRQRPELWLVLASALVVVAAFPFPLRSGPETIRFLTPAYLPLAALVAAAPATKRRAFLLALLLAALHLQPGPVLVRAWRENDSPLVPDCRPVLRALDARAIRHAWASYNTAYCLTYMSGGRVVASQPWNERFPGYPLPFRREVRLAPETAWVLLPGADFRMPSPTRLENWLTETGGHWRRTEVAGALVYDAFVPPFSPRVRSLTTAGRAGDGRPQTRVLQPARGPATFRLETAAKLAAVSFVGSASPPGLPRGLVVEVSPDGISWEEVWRTRPRLYATQLMWANGQPQARSGIPFLSVPLANREVLALRLTPTPPRGPWAVAEVLLHPPDDDRRHGKTAPAWQGAGNENRGLPRAPAPDRSDHYFRALVLAQP